MAKLKMEVGLIWKMNTDTLVLDIISMHSFGLLETTSR